MFDVLGSKIVVFRLGSTIDQAFVQLKDCEQLWGCKTYGFFNGVTLSCDDTIDEAYVKVCGKTKEKSNKEEAEWMRKYEEEEQLHKEKIPQLTDEYIEKAIGVIREDKMEEWKNCVPARLNDLYKGEDLQATLDLAVLLKEKRFDEAEKLFSDQGHSGCSHTLVCNMLNIFAENGEDFVERVNK